MRTELTPIEFIGILADFSVEEFGGRFMFLDWKRGAKDREARAWLEVLRSLGLVKGGPWRVHLDDIHQRTRESHPELFDGKLQVFEVYRIDKDAVDKLFSR